MNLEFRPSLVFGALLTGARLAAGSHPNVDGPQKLCLIGGVTNVKPNAGIPNYSNDCYSGTGTDWTSGGYSNLDGISVGNPNTFYNRLHSAAAVFQSRMCVVGGLIPSSDGPSAWVPNSGGECLPFGTAWTQLGISAFTVKLPNMATHRSELGLVVFGGKLCAIGGVDDNFNSLASTQCFDGTAWAAENADIPAMPGARHGAGVIVYDNVLYVTGGTNSALADFMYSWDGTAWSTVSAVGSHADFKPWRGHGIGIYLDKLCVVGGQDTTFPASVSSKIFCATPGGLFDYPAPASDMLGGARLYPSAGTYVDSSGTTWLCVAGGRDVADDNTAVAKDTFECFAGTWGFETTMRKPVFGAGNLVTWNAPTPSPTTAPTRAPTPDPTPDPTPAPTPAPTPDPTPDPTPAPITAPPTTAPPTTAPTTGDGKAQNGQAGGPLAAAEETNLGLIIGCAAGGLLFVAAIIFFVHKKHKAKKAAEEALKKKTYQPQPAHMIVQGTSGPDQVTMEILKQMKDDMAKMHSKLDKQPVNTHTITQNHTHTVEVQATKQPIRRKTIIEHERILAEHAVASGKIGARTETEAQRQKQVLQDKLAQRSKARKDKLGLEDNRKASTGTKPSDLPNIIPGQEKKAAKTMDEDLDTLLSSTAELE